MALKPKSSKRTPRKTKTKKAGAFWIGPNHMERLRPLIETAKRDDEAVTAFIVGAIEAEIKRRQKK